MTDPQPMNNALLWRCTHTGCITQIGTDGDDAEQVAQVHEQSVAAHQATHPS